MATEPEHRRQRSLQAMIGDVLRRQAPLTEPLSDEVEDLLWDYAQGLLEPPEENRVIRLLARSPQAEAALAGIRQSLLEAGAPLPIEPEPSVLELARRRSISLIAAMSEPASLAAVVVNMGDRLMAVVGQAIAGPYLHALEAAPALALGDDEEADQRPLQRVDIRGGHGLDASIIRLPDNQIDILVKTSNPAATGRVRLLKLEQVGAEVTEQDAVVPEYLASGIATLKDCPAGLLRIVVPDGRDLLISLEAVQP
jgi:hypothetical protein